LQQVGQTPDPKVAQIERLKADVDKINGVVWAQTVAMIA
jgi:hypothetical protein